jgi:haloacid dehalogenase superfamily, subfamily IA, variant 3 with third motif having DD or ED/haloacid dehalogenase superfamily, subfamily IA, variant 1 with third motif having Dx(3-4)D or Dx(3-4)E
MQNIKAIIFDFGGVILNIDFNKTHKAFADLGVKDFYEMYSQKNADHLFRHLEEGKLSEDEFYDAFRRSIKLELTNEQIKNAWNALLVSYRKEALNTLKVIKEKYQLYLLSNTNSIHQWAFNKIYDEEIGKGSLEDYFDKVYFSHKIGYRKPDKEAYEYVLKENNLSPAQTLFIDDSIQNIKPAEELGIQAIFLKEGMRIEELGL